MLHFPVRKKKEKGERPPHFRASVILSFAAALLLAFFLMLFLFRVKNVEVVGNYHETDSEVTEAIMSGPMSGNTLILSTFLRHPSLKDMPFVSSVTINATGRDSIRITVTEIPAVACLAFNGSYYYFDEEGKVLLKTSEGETRVSEKEEDEEVKIIPLVYGLNSEKPVQGEKLAVADDSVFSTIVSIAERLNKYQIDPNRLAIRADGTWMLVIDKIRVLLGADEYMEDKLLQLAGILPEAEGLSGTLHLENYDGTQNRIIFDQDD